MHSIPIQPQVTGDLRRRLIGSTGAFRLGAVTVIAVATAVFPVCRAQAATSNPLGFMHSFRCTADPAAATTVPGWIIVAGSPALRCADALPARWPRRAAPRFVVASGPYGGSMLEKVIRLRAGGSHQSRYTLSASFGASGHGPAQAILVGKFFGPSGKRLGATVVLGGPAAATQRGPVRFEPRSVGGWIPHGAVSLKLSLDLGGKIASAASYIAAMRLEVVPAMSFPAVSPPLAHVPRFDYVFLIMMENTDFGQVIGDSRNAPYIDSLAARGTLLANYQAVYHPSDENYLAIAGGDTFVRGPVYFPNIHVAGPNLGDLLEAVGKSWKTYEEGMGTPCNTAKQFDKYYMADDAPFINFDDIQRNFARCRAHLVPLRDWPEDLRRSTTTPTFAWLAADDYNDGEASGNGSPKSLRVQDAWLRRTLAPLFRSPAWRNQSSLVIITWDESDTPKNNHIATIVLGSRGTVRSGYVSVRQYDDYSTARVIEAALGLPSMTSNDGYARAFDDAFVAH
jgi:hypothetical protein